MIIRQGEKIELATEVILDQDKKKVVADLVFKNKAISRILLISEAKKYITSEYIETDYFHMPT